MFSVASRRGTKISKRLSSASLTDSMNNCVEKFLIFHPNLPSLCDASIDESSSLEELTQHVLYFFQKRESNDLQDHDACACAHPETVAFLGLCEALYRFPNEITTAKHDNSLDRSKDNNNLYLEVQFESKSLIFFPLEKICSTTYPYEDTSYTEKSQNTLVGVAQITQGSSSLSVQSSLQQCHELFCLLRSGGILPRLMSIHKSTSVDENFKHSNPSPSEEAILDDNASLSENSIRSQGDDSMPPDISDTLGDFSSDYFCYINQEQLTNEAQLHIIQKDDSTSNHSSGISFDLEGWDNDGCLFPGMKTIYQMHKRIRQKGKQLSKVATILELKRKSLQIELGSLIEKFETLHSMLPIQAIRHELKAHYDEFLLHISLQPQSLKAPASAKPFHRDKKYDTFLSEEALITLPHTAFQVCCPMQDSIQALLSNSSQISLDSQEKRHLQLNRGQQSQNQPQMVAITSFFQGNWGFHETNVESLDYTRLCREFLNPELTSSQIRRYMQRMDQRRRRLSHHSSQVNITRSSSLRSSITKTETSQAIMAPPVKKLLTQVQDSLHHMSTSISGGRETSSVTSEERIPTHGEYLPSPPLSMLTIADTLFEVKDSILGNVWLPTFSVPVQSGHWIPLHVACYILGDYTFLIYLKDCNVDSNTEALELSVSSLYQEYFLNMALSSVEMTFGSAILEEEDEPQTPLSEILTNVSMHLTQCVLDSNAIQVSMNSQQVSIPNLKGVVCMLVNRDLDYAIIYYPGNDGGSDWKMGRLKAHHPKDDLSCIHNLGCTWNLRKELFQILHHFETVDILQDMMYDIFYGQQGMEICTYQSPAWIWASSSASLEFYIMLDNKEYATIQQVKDVCDGMKAYFSFASPTSKDSFSEMSMYFPST
jgi:hypothetical protein